ncbi:MAG: hypothetical protein JWQ71_1001 [Pedosphaera sp.]|nr:hypothetical protein [Pedosphaera sp.]
MKMKLEHLPGCVLRAERGSVLSNDTMANRPTGRELHEEKHESVNTQDRPLYDPVTVYLNYNIS